MKVIFIKNLRGQGKVGEIKEVKDGYAQNFLIRNGYAQALTEKNLTKHQQMVRNQEKEDARLTDDAKKVKENLEKKTFIFKVKTGEGDRVFGSVSPKQIKDELEKNGFSIDKKQIELDHNLSSLGYHDVSIRLYKEVIAKIKVQLTK